MSGWKELINGMWPGSTTNCHHYVVLRIMAWAQNIIVEEAYHFLGYIDDNSNAQSLFRQPQAAAENCSFTLGTNRHRDRQKYLLL
jgi:hypothetical protein